MIETIKNKWLVIKNNNHIPVYAKSEPVILDGKEYVRQIIYSKDSMSRGVYLLKKYEFKEVFCQETNRKCVCLYLEKYDEVLSGLDVNYLEKIQRLGLVSEEELELLTLADQKEWNDRIVELKYSPKEQKNE